ncbi:MAG: HK97 gp10 family phage protein [Eubacteriales bacterium]|nr:HK97 gp10 family phage protein [Eubacteriales bacterium]
MVIHRLDNLLSKFNRLGDVPESVLRVSVARETASVQAKARIGLGRHSKTGELINSIHIMTEVYEGGVRGICFTDKNYAAHVEFGTGPNGEAMHAGISPAVTPAYVQHGWMIPAKAMSREEAEDYGLGVVEKGGKVLGYLTNGQQAHPYMYPALKDNEDTIIKNIGADIKKGVRRI